MPENFIALLISISTLSSSILGIIITFKREIKTKWKVFAGIFFAIILGAMIFIMQTNKSSGIIYTKFTKFEKLNNHYYFSGNQISTYYTPLVFSNNKKMKFRYDIDNPTVNKNKPLFSGFAMSFPNYSEASTSPKFEKEQNYLNVTLNQQSMTQYFANINFDRAVTDEGSEKCTYTPLGWLGLDYHNEKISNPQALTFILDFSSLDEEIIFLEDDHKPSYKIVKDDTDKDTPCRGDGEMLLLRDLKKMSEGKESGGKGIWVANIKEKIPNDWTVVVKFHPDN